MILIGYGRDLTGLKDWRIESFFCNPGEDNVMKYPVIMRDSSE